VYNTRDKTYPHVPEAGTANQDSGGVSGVVVRCMVGTKWLGVLKGDEEVFAGLEIRRRRHDEGASKVLATGNSA